MKPEHKLSGTVDRFRIWSIDELTSASVSPHGSSSSCHGHAHLRINLAGRGAIRSGRGAGQLPISHLTRRACRRWLMPLPVPRACRSDLCYEVYSKAR